MEPCQLWVELLDCMLIRGGKSHCLGTKASFQIFALVNNQVGLLMPHNSEHVGKGACLKYAVVCFSVKILQLFQKKDSISAVEFWRKEEHRGTVLRGACLQEKVKMLWFYTLCHGRVGFHLQDFS